MKLESIANNTEDSQEKISSLINQILLSDHKIFADKYSYVKDLVRSLSNEERSILVRMVNNMYRQNPNSALGFTLYGGLRELSHRVIKQLKSREVGIRGIAIYIIRRFNQKDAYNDLDRLLESEKDLRGNILVTLATLDFKRTLPKLKEYMLSEDENEVFFVAYNLFYNFKNEDGTNNRKRIESILRKRKNGKDLIKKSYKMIEKMTSDYDSLAIWLAIFLLLLFLL